MSACLLKLLLSSFTDCASGSHRAPQKYSDQTPVRTDMITASQSLRMTPTQIRRRSLRTALGSDTHGFGERRQSSIAITHCREAVVARTIQHGCKQRCHETHPGSSRTSKDEPPMTHDHRAMPASTFKTVTLSPTPPQKRADTIKQAANWVRCLVLPFTFFVWCRLVFRHLFSSRRDRFLSHS